MFYNLAFFLVALTHLTSPERPHLYFGYASNLNSEFMIQERVKNGTWSEEGWDKKTGVIEGPAPLDCGTYILKDYAFRYNLIEVVDGVPTGAGNVVPSPGSYVLGALYNVSTLHLGILDQSEDEGTCYKRTALKVQKVACTSQGFKVFPEEEVEAFVYVGLEGQLSDDVAPDPFYVDFVIRGAKSRHFPEDYIKANFVVPKMAQAVSFYVRPQKVVAANHRLP